ncbi:MAG: hypothetical protein R6V07_16660 [Armatimonadota bacterium]
MPRIAVAEFSHETDTFFEGLATFDDFVHESRVIRRGLKQFDHRHCGVRP